MPDLITVYWRDIPAQVIARAGRKAVAKVQLSERFEKAIDRAAMRAKLRDTDSYLAEWRRQPVPCGEDLEGEVKAAAERLEQDFPDERLTRFVMNGGLDPDKGAA
jgi:hypothetical protein